MKYLALGLLFLVACADGGTVPDFPPAVVTFAYDDSRMTHRTAADHLNAAGLRGTFNLVTSYLRPEFPYHKNHRELARHLVATGHEIGSHTVTHSGVMTGWSDEKIRRELVESRRDLFTYAGVFHVESFTYPGNGHDERVRALVAEYYTTARGGWGFNDTVPDRYQLKGRGYYEPFELAAMVADVDRAIASGSWVILYFHGIGDALPTQCPTEIHRGIVDYVAARAREGACVVLPQGEAFKAYTR